MDATVCPNWSDPICQCDKTDAATSQDWMMDDEIILGHELEAWDKLSDEAMQLSGDNL